jgi:phage terminase Nu1 subunit (DNA packaging protein)
MIVKTTDLAELFDVTDRAIRLWAKRGCPKLGHGTWDMKAVFQWWIENVYHEGADSEALALAKQKYWESKARSEKVKADLAEDAVMSIDELKKAWAWRIGQVSTGLGQIPLRLAPLVVGKTEMEIRGILDNEMWKIRDTYSRTGKFCHEVKK